MYKSNVFKEYDMRINKFIGGGYAHLVVKSRSLKKLWLSLILTFFSAVFLFCAFFVSFNDGKSAIAAQQIKTSAAYLDLNGDGNILNGFEGAQKEYVYMGRYNNSPVKWRVLSKNDGKYSNGNMLLWSDSQLGTCQFNPVATSNYAFWGTSKLRATLNGGNYPESASGTAMPALSQSVTESASMYGTMFEAGEKTGIVAAKQYDTDNWGFLHPQYVRDGITVGGYGTVGKYNSSIFGAGTAQYAANTAAGGVRETTSGDKLFLLDYYDINNTAYGFGDSGLTYARKMNGSWTTSTGYYPCYYDNHSVNSQYLKFSDSVSWYWIRTAGRYDAYGGGALFVDKEGWIGGDHANVNANHGVRPALNLDTAKIGYLTTAKPTGNLTSMQTAVATPAYLIYFKSADYDNYSGKAKAVVVEKDGALNVIYNNPTGKSGGSLVLLFSDKTKTDGSVDYQTAVTMCSTSATDKKFAKVNLSSGVSLSTHNLTVLYTSSTAGNATEEIYCSYATDNGVDAPNDISNLTYDGTSKWITDLSSSEKPSWLDLDIYNNDAYISAVSITYRDNSGNAVKAVQKSEIKAAGEYEVTMTLASGLKWTGESTAGGDKKFKITVGKAEPTVTAAPDITGNPYVTGGLPQNDDKTAKVKNTASGGTAGTFGWVANQIPDTTQSTYKCLFTPTDTNNYKTKECSVNITFVEDEVNGVTAAVEADGTGSDKLYTSYSPDKLKAAPFNLKVELKYASGYREITSDYALSVLRDGSPQSVFYAGTNTVQVESNGYDCSFTVEVIAAEIDSVKSVDFNQNGKTIYPDTPLDDIKELFTVQVYWNYNTSKFEKIDKENFRLEGTLVAGTGRSELYIVYTKGGGEVRYAVPKGALDKITVDLLTFDLSGIAIADGSADYDGQTHGLEINGTLPAGVTAEYLYECTANGYNSSDKPANAGEYTVTVTFTHSNENYNAITDSKLATLTINKINYPGADRITFSDKTVTLGGEYGLEAENVPEGVTVTYEGNGQTELGVHTVTAKFSHAAPNYKDIPDKTATLTITDKKVYDKSGLGITLNGGAELTVNYTGEAFNAVPTGKIKDVDGNEVNGVSFVVTVKRGEEEVNEIKDAGEYTVTVTYTGADSTYEPEFKLNYTVKVKGEYDLSEIKFEDVIIEFDKEEHGIEISGELPPGVTVTYTGGGREIGEYTITAQFSHANPNYGEIPDKTATLTITKRNVTIAIDPVSSEAGEELAEITATVTEGSILEGDTPYKLMCTPDKNTVGEYPVTWKYEEGYEGKYEITCEGGIYIVSKKADDGSGGSIDMPIEIDVDFKVIQADTKKEYPHVYGYASGYWVQLWYKNEDGTLGDEYVEKMNCVLTLKVPDGIIEAICPDGEVTKERIAEKLKVYCIDGDGDTVLVKNYALARREDGSWIVKFNYNGKFRAEVIFNAYGIEIDQFVPEEPTNSGIPMWIFIAAGLAILLILVIIIIAVTRRRGYADDYDDYDYDDDYDEDDDYFDDDY